VRNPERTVPRAALTATAAVVVLYISVQLVAQGILGTALADDRVAPLRRVRPAPPTDPRRAR
jgi:amino acid transporter